MDGKLFLVDKGRLVTIQNSDGEEIVFDTFEDFNTYYSGTLDLSGEYYIDYEPERKLLYRSAKDNFDPLTNEWNGIIQEYEDVIADIANMKAKREDPYFGLTLEQAVEYRLTGLHQSTYRTITTYMPEWRQIRWNEFVKLYEKAAAGNTLTPLEQTNYDGFPEEGETHEGCYSNCTAAFQWIVQCIAQHEQKKPEIMQAGGIDALKAVPDPDYPAWEL
ncbi:MAG: hypothetical protein GY950_04195 [bacterium]|nr:hypothetical protein [bacterium]